MPTVLDNFITIAKQDARQMGHDIGRMRRYGYVAETTCRQCGAFLYVNTHSGSPVSGPATNTRCGKEGDGGKPPT